MKKKFIPLLLAALPLALSVTSCGGSAKKVGILLPVQHVALEAATEGFKKALQDEKVNVTFSVQNAGGNEADLSSLAKTITDNCDLYLGVGTGASQALKGAATNSGYTKPCLFTAVTDPVDAGLVANADNPTGWCCGTTDANPVEAQVALIKEMKADADKMGIIYTQSETNSLAQANQAKAAAEAAGMTVEIRTCTNSSDILSTATALAGIEGMDAIYVPTDNNIAANMNAIKTAADNAHVLVVCGEEGMLTAGGHVTLSISYYRLGYDTGKMAAEILRGNKKPTDYKVVKVPASSCSYIYSSDNLTASGLTMPQSVLDAHAWEDASETEENSK